MNKKAFTLVELLAVIVILSIIMTIAIPNVVSTLEKSKKETYIADAKKFLTLAKTELVTNINNPTGNELVKIKLSCVDNQDLTKDPNGDEYDEENSFVIVVKKNSKIVYYVNLVSVNSNGIKLVEKTLLDQEGRLKHIKKEIPKLTDNDIKSITGQNGSIRTCSN